MSMFHDDGINGSANNGNMGLNISSQNIKLFNSNERNHNINDKNKNKSVQQLYKKDIAFDLSQIIKKPHHQISIPQKKSAHSLKRQVK